MTEQKTVRSIAIACIHVLRHRNQFDMEDKEISIEKTVKNIEHALQVERDEVERLNKIIGGIDVENPDAVNVMIDAMKAQKEYIDRLKVENERLLGDANKWKELVGDTDTLFAITHRDLEITKLQSHLAVCVEALKWISNCAEDADILREKADEALQLAKYTGLL